jgi:hypothetical protein
VKDANNTIIKQHKQTLKICLFILLGLALHSDRFQRPRVKAAVLSSDMSFDVLFHLDPSVLLGHFHPWLLIRGLYVKLFRRYSGVTPE